MNIIITNRFQKKYLDKNKKYFSQEEFVEHIQKKHHTFISLHHPFFKFKNNIGLVSFRGVVFSYQKNSIVPILMFLKKDKKKGENINWFTDRDFIKNEFVENMKDVEKGNFEIYT